MVFNQHLCSLHYYVMLTALCIFPTAHQSQLPPTYFPCAKQKEIKFGLEYLQSLQPLLPPFKLCTKKHDPTAKPPPPPPSPPPPEGPTWDPQCFRAHSYSPQKFGCHKDTCSSQNEAAYLGVFAPRFMNDKFFFEEEWDKATLRYIWDKFVQMELPPAFLEKVPLKSHLLEATTPPPGLKDDPAIKDEEEKGFIPRSCDFRNFLYCETSIRLSDKPELGKEASKCSCHALYSVEVPDVDEPTIINCHGRPGVPCEYELSDNLNNNGLHIEGVNSTCMQGTSCKALTKGKEEQDFRQGLIFQGYGLSPIMTRYFLMFASKICKCDSAHGSSDEDYTFQNKMHECVIVPKVKGK